LPFQRTPSARQGRWSLSDQRRPRIRPAFQQTCGSALRLWSTGNRSNARGRQAGRRVCTPLLLRSRAVTAARSALFEKHFELPQQRRQASATVVYRMSRFTSAYA
jgi:hypothetical protein